MKEKTLGKEMWTTQKNHANIDLMLKVWTLEIDWTPTFDNIEMYNIVVDADKHFNR